MKKTQTSEATAAETEMIEVELAGFWRRAGALFFDVAFSNILAWVLVMVFIAFSDKFGDIGKSVLAQSVTVAISFVPLVYVIGFWIFKQATLGKMLGCIRIVDARTLGKPSVAQCLIRFAGILFSVLTLGAGFMLMLRDKKGQTVHDKLARTIVIRSR